MLMNIYLPVSHLREVGALGRPHGCSPESKHKGCGQEGVELGVELGGDVGGVAEDAHHQSPLHRHLLDHDGGDEHAGDGEGCVKNCLRARAQPVHLIEGSIITIIIDDSSTTSLYAIQSTSLIED